MILYNNLYYFLKDWLLRKNSSTEKRSFILYDLQQGNHQFSIHSNDTS